MHCVYNTTQIKREYVVDKLIHHMLRLAAKFGYVTDLLFISMYYYKTCRFRKALSVIEAIWGKWLSRYIPPSIVLTNNTHFIDELIPEGLASKQNMSLIVIPTTVLIYMLEFLCSRHVNKLKAQAALNELEVEVHHPQNVVSLKFWNISWEILGICQQIAGHHQAALYSYQQSLRQIQITSIQTATRQRLRDLPI